jgi:NAD(P)-dependent dehydrogenase (short-subunit alcohol dehydrogenase family)
MRFENKNVLVTGGNSGIGLAATRLFVKEGATVIITGRNQETLDQAKKEFGSKVIAIKADVKDLDAIKSVMTTISKEVGKLDVVYANAGIVKPHTLGSTTVELFTDVIQTNLISVYFLIQEALPLLNEKASIVLNSSVVPSLGMAGNAAYSASKAGILGLMTSIAAELSPRGIRVNTVVPGAAKTPIWGEAPVEDKLKYTIPMGRMGEADEIANVVLFLASSESSFMQAATITVDGGATGAPLAALIYRQ